MDNILAEKLNGLIPEGRIRLRTAVLSKKDRSLTAYFNSSAAVSTAISEEMAATIKSFMPAGVCSVKVDVTKIVALKEFVVPKVLRFFNEKHKIVCSSVKEGDVNVTVDGFFVKTELSLESSVFSFCNEKNVGNELKAYLEDSFVEDFTVLFYDRGATVADAESLKYVPDERETQMTLRRKLKVDEVTKYFDDDRTDTATYIADTDGFLGEVYLAGKIVSIREQTTKNDKPFFKIDISDRTGVATGTVFPTKDKLPKMRKLSEGVGIIIRGEYEMRGEYRNLRINSINLCVFPDNFVPQPRPKKPVPENYYLVRPQPLVIEKQESFLDVKKVPDAFIGRTFVVFDFETTGTDFDDKITEIGAVKVVDGKPTEYFSTLINPKKHIPQDVVAITGIDDTTVADAPYFEEVCPDFYKFCHDSTLVAHNIEFDSRFLKNQSAPLDYVFDNPQMDTLALARECIYGVANYKLNTLCDKFGIVFRHHRAFADALATAELFIEIIRIRGSLPF
ncbi:MAG: 3'-5' exoribonuclease [Clostridia bacterium]|nr:3'-5' exoribonuclease [Clostridia bacterium]